MKVRLIIRGFAAGVRQFEDRVEIEEDLLDEVIPSLAIKHGAALADHALHMIEIEFLDEPDVNQRFLRFGTDPAGMVAPIKIDLEGTAS